MHYSKEAYNYAHQDMWNCQIACKWIILPTEMPKIMRIVNTLFFVPISISGGGGGGGEN